MPDKPAARRPGASSARGGFAGRTGAIVPRGRISWVVARSSWTGRGVPWMPTATTRPPGRVSEMAASRIAGRRSSRRRLRTVTGRAPFHSQRRRPSRRRRARPRSPSGRDPARSRSLAVTARACLRGDRSDPLDPSMTACPPAGRPPTSTVSGPRRCPAAKLGHRPAVRDAAVPVTRICEVDVKLPTDLPDSAPQHAVFAVAPASNLRKLLTDFPKARTLATRSWLGLDQRTERRRD
jgi:hypothetical protein